MQRLDRHLMAHADAEQKSLRECFVNDFHPAAIVIAVRAYMLAMPVATTILDVADSDNGARRRRARAGSLRRPDRAVAELFDLSGGLDAGGIGWKSSCIVQMPTRPSSIFELFIAVTSAGIEGRRRDGRLSPFRVSRCG